MDDTLDGVGSDKNKFRDCDWQMNGARSRAMVIKVFIGISHTVLYSSRSSTGSWSIV